MRMFSSEKDCSRMKLTGLYDVFPEEGGEKQDWEDSAPVGVSPARRHCSPNDMFQMQQVMQAIESYMVFSLQVALK